MSNIELNIFNIYNKNFILYLFNKEKNNYYQDLYSNLKGKKNYTIFINYINKLISEELNKFFNNLNNNIYDELKNLNENDDILKYITDLDILTIIYNNYNNNIDKIYSLPVLNIIIEKITEMIYNNNYNFSDDNNLYNFILIISKMLCNYSTEMIILLCDEINYDINNNNNGKCSPIKKDFITRAFISGINGNINKNIMRGFVQEFMNITTVVKKPSKSVEENKPKKRIPKKKVDNNDEIDEENKPKPKKRKPKKKVDNNDEIDEENKPKKKDSMKKKSNKRSSKKEKDNDDHKTSKTSNKVEKYWGDMNFNISDDDIDNLISDEEYENNDNQYPDYSDIQY